MRLRQVSLRLVIACLVLLQVLGLFQASEGANLGSWALKNGALHVNKVKGKSTSMGMTHWAVFGESRVQVTGYYGFNDRGYPLPIDEVKMREIGGIDGEIAEGCSGSQHTLVLLKNGKMKSWGLNTYGSVGIGKISAYEIQDAQEVSRRGIPSSSTIVSIACAAYNSYALAEDGTLYAWGYGKYGMNGRGSHRDKPFPQAISRLGFWPTEMITQVFPGFQHVLVRTSAGRLLCWGDNTRGACGIASQKKLLHKPQEVVLPAGYQNKVKDVASGNGFTILLMHDGTVWGTGMTDKGQYRKSDANAPFLESFVKITSPPVRQIHATHSTSFYMLEDGRLQARGSHHWKLGPQKPRECPFSDSVVDIKGVPFDHLPVLDSKGFHLAFQVDRDVDPWPINPIVAIRKPKAPALM